MFFKGHKRVRPPFGQSNELLSELASTSSNVRIYQKDLGESSENEATGSTPRPRGLPPVAYKIQNGVNVPDNLITLPGLSESVAESAKDAPQFRRRDPSKVLKL